MSYQTDRKRAAGKGSLAHGADHQLEVTYSSYMMAALVLLFLFRIAPLIGAPYEVVIEGLTRPFNFVIMGLFVVSTTYHWRFNIKKVFEDYVPHGWDFAGMIITTALGWFFCGLGLFALAKILIASMIGTAV
ncbi:MAG: succinate dehydrogenase, hydrophobic membrane anchor protein [Tropicimonas sp.]|uniref:succinate dehydrogenase, hydrophobic membrane anchor protein n=1 Tax=Tropicimonas sp. TaxID=2067044 RepID=UPI003A8B685A